MVTVTENAAAKIKELMAQEPEGEVSVLRIAIQGGGCSGFQYALGFDRGPQDGDNEIEMMSIVSSRYDVARFGAEVFRSSPRQADLLIVSGRVSHKMTQPLREIYDQMLMPKWVIAMGACASSGGMFNNYAILQGVDKIVPVDIHVPGCPPRPEALMEGIVRLHEKVMAGVPPAYEIRGVAE